MTHKSKIDYPVQPWNLPTYEGIPPGKGIVRSELERLGGQEGIRSSEWTDLDGTTCRLNTRNGFPEVIAIQKPQQAPEVDAPKRGFVAHNPAGQYAALFSPYSLAVANAKYPVFNHTYTVLPFATTYNVPSSDTTKWNDVLSFYNGAVRVNAISNPILVLSGAPSDALPWLIPHFSEFGGLTKYGDKDVNSYEKRVFAISRDHVHSWVTGAIDAVLNNPSARPYKALMCGAKVVPIENKAWISQFAFTGDTWDAYSGGWAFTAAEVSMMLTPPYLTKLNYGSAAEQPLCIPGLVSNTYTTGYSEAMSFPPCDVGIRGNAVLGVSGTLYQHVLYPATGIVEWTGLVGEELGSKVGALYASSSSFDVDLGQKVATVTSTSNFSKLRHVGQAHNADTNIAINPGAAPTYTSIFCNVDGTTSPASPEHGVRGSETALIGGWTSGQYADHWREESEAIFSISIGGTVLVGGRASRKKNYGTQVKLTKIPWASGVIASEASLYTMIVNADGRFGIDDPRTDTAISTMSSTASSFVGQAFIWNYDYTYQISPHYTSTLEARPDVDDRLLSWETKDYLLYDETNGCFISVDAVFSGEQRYGESGTATLAVNLRIVTPMSTVTQTMFSVQLSYGDILPTVELDDLYAYVPVPQQRVIFTPKYQEQGDFIGAAYTTSAEASAGAVPAYLFNFVLRLGTYYEIGSESGDDHNINFIPCNLLEMLYAYVYSSKYGIDLYQRYPVDNAARFNSFQASLFSATWRVNYRDGVLIDWLDTLGSPYVTETTTELYRI